MKRLIGALLILFCFVGISHAARRVKAGPVPRPGILDEPRSAEFSKISRMETISLLTAAEQQYRDENYEKALTSFAELLTKPGADIITPYLEFMIGACHLFQDDYAKAIAQFRKVITEWPKSADATQADYFIGAAYKFDYKDDEATAHYMAYVENPDRLSRKEYKDYYDKALKWVVDETRKKWKRSPSLETATPHMKYLELMVKDDPKSIEWHTLFDHYFSLEQWDECDRIVRIQKKGDEAVFYLTRQRLNRTWRAHAGTTDEAKRKEIATGATATLAAVMPVVASFKGKDEEKYRDLYFQALKVTVDCGHDQQAKDLVSKWMTAYPKDRVGIFTYTGYLAGAKQKADTAFVNKLFTDFMKAAPPDLETFVLYEKAVRQLFDDRSPAVALVQKFKGPDYIMGRLYEDWQDDKADAHFLKASSDEAIPDDYRKYAAAWIGMRRCKAGKRDEAVPYLEKALELEAKLGMNRIEGDTWRNALAYCYDGQGRREEALKLWAQHARSRSGVLRAICDLEQAREKFKVRNYRDCAAAERTLREIAGDGRRYRLNKDEPEAQKVIAEAKKLCDEQKINLAIPYDANAWKTKLAQERQ